MKKYISLFVLLAAFSIAKAQQPEFSLPVKLVVNNDSVRSIVFGYDPTASDATNEGPKWLGDIYPGGEQEYPSGQQGDLDFRMAGYYISRPELLGGGPIDVRKKPSLDSFTLKYEMDLQVVPGTTNAKIEWNPQSIPAKINRITLASYHFPHTIRLDMKTQSSFVFPLKDSGESLYSSMILTLYYNTVEIEKLAVRSTGNISDELILYPNPMDSRSQLHFLLNEDSRITLSIYDITGKKVLNRIIDGTSGENTLDLWKNDLSSHAGVYLLKLSGIQKGKSLERSKTIIVR